MPKKIPVDAESLLNRALELVSKDLKAMASNNFEKRLNPQDALSLARYITSLNTVMMNAEKLVNGEMKKLSKFSYEDWLKQASEVVKGSSND